MILRKAIYTLLLSILIIVVSSCRDSNVSENVRSTTQESLFNESNANCDLHGRLVKIGVFDASWAQYENNSILTASENNPRKQVPEKYNCKIEWVDLSGGMPSKDVSKKIDELYAQVFAGIQIPDIIAINGIVNYIPLINKGYLLPLDEYIDFNTEPYNLPIQQSTLWRRKHYGVVSEQGGVRVSSLYYNTKLLKQLGLSDVYELQQKGQWTWDEFLDMAEAATCDTNGDGAIDQWGVFLGTNWLSLYKSLAYSNDAAYIQEKDGEYLFSPDKPEALEALKFLKELYTAYNVVKTDFQGSINSCAFTTTGGSTFQQIYWPMGPKADSYMPFATPSEFMAVNALSKDIEAVAYLLKDYFSPYSSNGYTVKDLNGSFLNGGIRRGDVNRIMNIKSSLIAQYDYFAKHQPLQILLNETIRNIISNDLPPTSVMDIKEQAQKLIDEYARMGMQ